MVKAPKGSERKKTGRAKAQKALKTSSKRVPVKKPVEEKPIAPPPRKRTYRVAVGRRKSAVARVRVFEQGTGTFLINGRELREYFPNFILQNIAQAPLLLTNLPSTIDVSAKIRGGGSRGQAEALRLGLSRVLVTIDPALRSTLKSAGFLTRDPRVKERKKYGLKRARRAPQWQKR